jgi:hypothetical protein
MAAALTVVIPDLPWPQYVATGELARNLTRLCWLVQERVSLAIRVELAGEEVVATIALGERARTIRIEAPGESSRPHSVIAAILEASNDVVAAAGSTVQFALSDGTRDLTIAIRDSASELAPPPAPPTFERIADDNGSLLAFIAGYCERLATFAGLAPLTCKARWVQDPGSFTFTMEGSSVHTTVRVPQGAELEVQPILDDLNLRLRMQEAPVRIYRVARTPDRIDVALLDQAAAAAARRAGELIEHPAREVLRVLATAGFELPAMSGEWRYWYARDSIGKLVTLARGHVDLACTVAVTDDDTLVLRWVVADIETTHHYGPEHGDEPAVTVLGTIIGDLNRLLARTTCPLRCVVMRGEPQFYGHRMFLLDPAWLQRVARLRELAPNCIDTELLGTLPELAAVAPPDVPASSPPRVLELEEILDRADIREDDFKCSARPSDFDDLIQEIARFARIAVEVSPHFVHDGDDWIATVTYRGHESAVRIEDSKYVNPRPILEYLNGLLATRTPLRQLYHYRAGGYAGGLVRATDEQARQLRELGYIS